MSRRLVWNKNSFERDPDTRKRVSKANPLSAHQSIEVPDLRIIDNATWKAVRARKSAAEGKQPHQMARPTLLTGLIKCGGCGGPMASIGGGRRGPRVQCVAYREKGTCTNKLTTYRSDVERTVLSGLADLLRHKDAIAAAVKRYNAERAKLAKAADRDRASLERRKAEIERQLERIADAIVQGTAVSTLKVRADALEIEQGQLLQALATEPDNIVSLHPQALQRYMDAIKRLSAMTGAEGSEELRAAVRTLIGSVTVNTDRTVEIYGLLRQLTNSAKGAVKVASGARCRPTPRCGWHWPLPSTDQSCRA